MLLKKSASLNQASTSNTSGGGRDSKVWPLSASILLALFLIVVFAAGIRFLGLGTHPKGSLIDESHFGYLAYSLLHTGRDERGVPWPVIFEGFGDQKLPLYAYALVPVVQFLGLNTLAIRIPSLVAGVWIVIAIFGLLRELRVSARASLLGAFMAACNPWPFFLSRIGFESNLALAFWVSSLWLLARFGRFNENSKVKNTTWGPLVAAAVLAGTTWYAYVAYRPVVLIVPAMYLVAVFWKRWRELGKALTIYIGTLLIFVAPLLLLPSAVGSNTARFKQIGILSDGDITREIDEKRRYCGLQLQTMSKLCYTVWNKPIVISYVLARRYVHTFSPQYLVTQGEEGLEFLTVERTGQFYFLLYPFLILGILALGQKPIAGMLQVEEKWLVLAGTLLSPIPALLAGEAQKVRLSPLFPFLLIILVVGIEWVVMRLLPKWRLWFVGALLLATTAATFGYVLAFLTVHVYKYDYTYQSYLPDLYEYLKKYDGPDSQIFIKPFYSDPIMFYAYYRKIDPAHYQSSAILGPREASGFQHTVGLDNYHVLDEDMLDLTCTTRDSGKTTILVTNVTQAGADVEHIIYALNGAASQVYIYNLTENYRRHPTLCDDWKPS